MCHIPYVQQDAFPPAELRSAVDLAPASQPGPNIEPAKLIRRVLCNLLGNRWPRSDDRHISAQHVNQLGQFINLETPNPATDRGNSEMSACHLPVNRG